MSDFIGRTTVPAIVSSGLTFPLISDFGYGFSQDRPIVVHRFGTLDARIEQRFQVGIGPRRFTFKRQNLSLANKASLAMFWESLKGSYKSFVYNVPNADQSTTATTVCWEDSPLSFDYLMHACRVGVTFVEIGNSSPAYAVASTCTRFPSGTLAAALADQVQQIIPLVRIRVREAAVSDIYLSDRRCTVGGQDYLPRVVGLGEPGSSSIISQSISGTADDVQFGFGNADGAMTALSNDTDLKYAKIELSLYHVNSGILLQAWAGYVQDFAVDGSALFSVRASDGIFQINQQYPNKTISRTCYKDYNDGLGCPWASAGASASAVIAAGGDPNSCDFFWNSTNGCLVHGMGNFFGGIPILPQSVSVKDNTTGFIGFDRNKITATSIVSDTIWGKALTEIWCNNFGDPSRSFIANALIAAVRDNGDFFDVLGILGVGPIGAFGVSGNSAGMFVTNVDGFTYLLAPLADGFPAHGLKVASNGLSTNSNSALGLRQVPGPEPISAIGDQSFNQFGLANIVGRNPSPLPFAPGIAFCELLYAKPSGISPSSADSHSMTVPIAQGLSGWVWDASGTRSSVPGLTNPFWIAINTFLRAIGLGAVDHATQEQYFIRTAVLDGTGFGCAEIADNVVAALVGAGTETQFQFQGTIDSQKPLRDWLIEILNTGLGYFSFDFGKLRLGCRINASAVDTYTLGNIKFQTLRLAPVEAAFEKLIIDFADVQYGYQANTAQYEDKTHTKYYGRSGAPLTSRMHSVGSPTLSQNLRVAATRTREEVGGVNPAEWRNARTAYWETTLLGLSNYVGQVVSITDTAKIPGLRGVCNVDGSGNVTWVSGDPFDTSMLNKQILIGGVQVAVTTLTGSPVTSFATTPAATPGAGQSFRIITMNFRIQSWQLRRDWSIAITGKTVTPSMYDLEQGPMPVDVLPEPLPRFFYPLPTDSAWSPFQVQYAANDALFPSEWTFGLAQLYSTSADDVMLASLLLTGVQPANRYSTGLYAPALNALTQAATGGTIPGGSLVRISICSLDAVGRPSTPSELALILIATGTNTNSITVSGISWPSVAGQTKYVVFAHTLDDLICVQVIGNLTAGGGGLTYTPTSLVITDLVRTSWALPNSSTSKVVVKAKHAVHSGVIGFQVDSVTSGVVTSAGLIDLTGGPFTPVGRVLSLIGRPTGNSPVFNTTITSWNPATGDLGCSPNPLGHMLGGDAAVIRFLGSDNHLTPTQITDTGIKNQPSDAYAGFTVDVEIGTLLRVIKGLGRGAVRKITSNTDDTLKWDTPLVMDATSVFITEEATWPYFSDATDVSSSDPLAVASFEVDTGNFQNEVLITSGFTVNSNGEESTDGDQPIRECWMFGAPAGPISLAPHTLVRIAGDVTPNPAFAWQILNVTAATTVRGPLTADNGFFNIEIVQGSTAYAITFDPAAYEAPTYLQGACSEPNTITNIQLRLILGGLYRATGVNSYTPA